MLLYVRRLVIPAGKKSYHTVNAAYMNVHTCALTPTETNGYAFIETSALDSTNVQLAFNNIIAGE